MRVILGSKVIRKIDYVFTTKQLTVHLPEGTKHILENVPDWRVKELLIADSSAEYYFYNLEKLYEKKTFYTKQKLIKSYLRRVQEPALIIALLAALTITALPVVDWLRTTGRMHEQRLASESFPRP